MSFGVTATNARGTELSDLTEGSGLPIHVTATHKVEVWHLRDTAGEEEEDDSRRSASSPRKMHAVRRVSSLLSVLLQHAPPPARRHSRAQPAVTYVTCHWTKR